MPTKLRITIDGLCVCYRGTDEWIVVFLCDDEHPLKLVDSAGDMVGKLHVANKDIDAWIAAGSFKPTGSQFGSNFERIFNLAELYAHDEGNLIRERRRIKTDLVTMRVPHSTLHTKVVTPRPYFVQLVTHQPGTPVELIGEVANRVVLTAEVDEPVVLKTSEGGEYQLAAQSGVIDVGLDNDCDGDCDYNDFIHIYEAFRDKRADRKFVAGQIKPPTLEDHEHLTEPSPELKNALKFYHSEQGNCDPVVIEPPPG